MKCLMCGVDDSGESAEAKADRLRCCRRCTNDEAGKIERTEAEKDGRGQVELQIHGVVSTWLKYVKHAKMATRVEDLPTAVLINTAIRARKETIAAIRGAGVTLKDTLTGAEFDRHRRVGNLPESFEDMTDQDLSFVARTTLNGA